MKDVIIYLKPHVCVGARTLRNGEHMKYTAIIGDIKDSRKLENREQIQKKLNEVLSYINEVYSADISAKFVITLGDELQGLLESREHILAIIQYIQREMYPVRLRFGVGIGEINTKIFPEAAIGADGPAYYAAREMINELREQEKRLKRQTADIQLAMYEKESFEITEINTMLALIKVVEDGWSEKQRYTIWDMARNSGTQKDCAKRMNTTQSTVARRLADGNYLTYERASKTVEEAIRHLGEGQDDNEIYIDTGNRTFVG